MKRTDSSLGSVAQGLPDSALLGEDQGESTLGRGVSSRADAVFLAGATPMFYALPMVLALLSQQPKGESPSAIDVVGAIETAVIDAIAATEHSVVAIAREKGDRGDETLAVKGKSPNPPEIDRGAPLSGLGSFQRDYVALDYGSGVVIGDEGQILTAYHVVKGASRLNVRAFANQQFDAEIIAADPRSDLAVIVPREVPGIAKPRLKPLTLGDASKLRKGAFLLALGNPYNAARDGKASAGFGILANIARRIEPTVRDNLQLRHYPTLLQLDSKLNLGMSGGAIVNLRGELVGLTTNAANASGFDAQAGYAMPVDILGRRVIETLIQGKEVEYGFLGIGLPDDRSNHVGNVTPGTPASEGGIVVGDEVLRVGGIRVSDSETLVAAVNAFSPGVPIKLDILRGQQRLEKTIVLSKFPLTGEVIATNRSAPWRGIRVDYLSMLPNRELGPGLLDAMSRGGVGVVEVIPGSSGDAAGLRTGQIILSVGDRLVKTPMEFAKAVAEANGPVELTTELNQKLTVK